MLKCKDVLFVNLVFKQLYFFRIWALFLKKINKFNFFFINLYLFKGFAVYYRLFNFMLYYNTYCCTIKSEQSMLNNPIYANKVVIRKNTGVWRIYLKWISACI